MLGLGKRVMDEPTSHVCRSWVRMHIADRLGINGNAIATTLHATGAQNRLCHRLGVLPGFVLER